MTRFDSAIEAAAKAEHAHSWHPLAWEDMPGVYREAAVQAKREGVTAFLDVMLDEDALANAIAHAGADWDYEFIEYREGKGDDPGPSAEYVTRAVVAYLKGDSNE